MKKICFLPDVDINIGMGHYFRCIALAQYLAPEFSIEFLLPENLRNKVNPDSFSVSYYIELRDVFNILPNYEILILDGYNFKTEFQLKCNELVKWIVYIDDLHSFDIPAQIVINQSLGVNTEMFYKSNQKVLTGPNYILLRNPFIQLAKNNNRNILKVEKLLINMGGSDANNLSDKIIKSVLSTGKFKKIEVVLGALNPHKNKLLLEFKNSEVSISTNLSSYEFADLMTECQIAILPASTVCLEAFSIGMGIISGYSADNQLDNLYSFADRGLIINAGNFNDIYTSTLTGIINKFVENLELINNQIILQKQFIDGKAPERYLKIFNSL